MRKQIVHQDAQNASAVNPVWLDLQGLAQVELTSEDQRSWRSSVVAGPEESVRQETDHANQIMPVGSRRAHFACSQKATKMDSHKPVDILGIVVVPMATKQ